MKKIIVDANFPNETRVVLLSSTNNIEAIEYETANKQQNKSNIYLAKITRIEPGLQAAFIEYDYNKSGFLPFTEIHPDYYHIPVSDQKTSIDNLKPISPPEFTSAELHAKPATESYHNPIVDSDEIDLKAIEKLIDERSQPEFELESSELDVEALNEEQRRLQEQIQRNYKIQEVLKKGQVLLVQLTKEERGNKGASFTTYVSLAGKYCVLMPNKAFQNGISRKISNAEERKRLKGIINKLVNEEDSKACGLIVRTAGIGRSNVEIKRDYDYLVRLWNKIRETTLKSSAPCFIHEEDGIIQKTIRDMFDHNVSELLIQGEEAFHRAAKFMSDILPLEVNKVKEYKSKTPIFTKFNIETQLSNLYQPVVPLPSGGYIVINPTEALISIDVNSGKATSERNIEETAVKTNLEAAKEIARHIKLRDLAGLLVIDFIDMYEARNRKIIERSFKEFLSRDRARIQTSGISIFGLLEVSRQRLRSSFLEVNTTICNHCNGKGLVRADESNAMLILRTVENEILKDNVEVVNVYASTGSVIYILNKKRDAISLIEKKYNIELNFYSDPNSTSDSYSIEKVKIPKNSHNKSMQNKPALQLTSEIYNSDEQTPTPQVQSGRRKVRHASPNHHKKPIPKDDGEGIEAAPKSIDSSQEVTIVAKEETIRNPAPEKLVDIKVVEETRNSAIDAANSEEGNIGSGSRQRIETRVPTKRRSRYKRSKKPVEASVTTDS